VGCWLSLSSRIGGLTVQDVISHQHRCIFVHVPKTAGKSVLAEFGLPEHGRDYRQRMGHIEAPYDHHPIREYQGRPWFDEYFKFGFVRNPWDRVVSAFFYLDAGGANAADAAFRAEHLAAFDGRFDLFVEGLPRLLEHKHLRPQTHWLTGADHRLAVDFVGRYERFSDDLALVCDRLGLGCGTPAHRNPSEHRDYRSYYDPVLVRQVAALYATDIEMFGYTFE